MITATYTDPYTQWEQRVVVSGSELPHAYETRSIKSAAGETAKVTGELLTDFRFELDENRRPIPAWIPEED